MVEIWGSLQWDLRDILVRTQVKEVPTVRERTGQDVVQNNNGNKLDVNFPGSGKKGTPRTANDKRRRNRPNHSDRESWQCGVKFQVSEGVSEMDDGIDFIQRGH